MTVRLREFHEKEVVPRMMKEFKYSNKMQVPRLKKIVVNMGLGEAVKDIKVIDAAARDLAAITGQKTVVTKAKKSIATFKLRAGMPIGCMVTLRGSKMFEFLDRLVNFSMPRIRDFRGTSDKSFDGRGNYTMGIREQIIFPEIDYDKIDKIRGMNITICTDAKTDEEAKALLKHLGMPFRA
ncbi:MAG: 50S ribosomal protein L5 [Deltaproteobacteria bacterium]